MWIPESTPVCCKLKNDPIFQASVTKRRRRKQKTTTSASNEEDLEEETAEPYTLPADRSYESGERAFRESGKAQVIHNLRDMTDL